MTPWLSCSQENTKSCSLTWSPTASCFPSWRFVGTQPETPVSQRNFHDFANLGEFSWTSSLIFYTHKGWWLRLLKLNNFLVYTTDQREQCEAEGSWLHTPDWIWWSSRPSSSWPHTVVWGWRRIFPVCRWAAVAGKKKVAGGWWKLPGAWELLGENAGRDYSDLLVGEIHFNQQTRSRSRNCCLSFRSLLSRS